MSVKYLNQKKYMSTSQLADYLSLSKHTINKYCKNGDLKCGHHYFKINKKRLFVTQAVEEFIIERNQQQVILKLSVDEIIDSVKI